MEYNQINYCIRCGRRLNLVKDREGKERHQCPNCGWVFYKNPIPAAACVVLRNKKEILIIKRRYAPGVGEWALPSGYIEIYQTPEQCALEELKEETNLSGKIKDFISYIVSNSPLYERVISFGFEIEILEGDLQAGDDAEVAQFIDIDRIPRLAFSSHNKFVEIIKNKYNL